jgi:hypothetical protein
LPGAPSETPAEIDQGYLPGEKIPRPGVVTAAPGGSAIKLGSGVARRNREMMPESLFGALADRGGA